MIERATLIEMFATLKDNGLNASEDLLWGFYFTDPDAEQLQALVPALESRGYRFIDLFEAEIDEEVSSEPMYYLHVEKVERHNIDSLDARNNEMELLAEQYGVAKYDGMDAGPLTAESIAFSPELN